MANQCKYYKQQKQYSSDGGVTWHNVIPAEYQKGALYEYESPDCIEYRWVNMDISTDWICDDSPELKLKATYSDSTEYYVVCNSSTTLSRAEVTGHSTPYSAMTTAIVGDCATSIGISAFQDCSGLTSIIIPDSVTNIGVNAFWGCSGLTSIDIPDSVTSISANAFYYCSSLSSVTIGSGVTSIYGGAFAICTSLARLNSNVDGVFNLPDSVTSIGDVAFEHCRSLVSINIGSGVTSIGDFVFYGCSGLTSITVEAITPPTITNSSLGNTNNCPIYVPAASVNTYKAASGWSDYASRIQAIPT